MRIVEKLVLVLMIAALSGVAATSTLAAPVWEGCLEGASTTKYENSKCLKALSTGKFGWAEIGSTEKIKGTGLTLSLTDTKVPIIGSTSVVCFAGEEDEGSVGPGRLGRIEVAKVKEASTNCRGRGGCKEKGIEKVEGVHLPWQTELPETEAGVDKIGNSGAGEPGWKITCETILGEKTADECTSEKESKSEDALVTDKATGETLLVLATYEDVIKAKCSLGGEEAGELEGSVAISTTSAAAFRVSLSPISVAPSQVFNFGTLNKGEKTKTTTFTYTNNGAAAWTPKLELRVRPPVAGGKDGIHVTNKCTAAVMTGKTCSVEAFYEWEEKGKSIIVIADPTAPAVLLEGTGK